MNRTVFVTLLLAFVATAYAQSYGRVKILHAFPVDAAIVDIVIQSDGVTVKAFTGVPFKAATEWFYLAYGTYNYAIYATGTTTNPLAADSLTVNSESLLVVAYADGADVGVNVFNDDISSIDAGDARVQVLHMAAGVGAVDVGPSAENTNAIAANLGYNALSAAISVTAGPVVAQVRATGDSGEPILTFSGSLEAGKGYLVVAVGSAGGIEGGAAPELIAIQMVDYSINSRVAFVHGIPAADLTVNVIANDNLPLFRGVKPTNYTDYYNVPVATHTLTVVPAGSSTAAISVTAFFDGFTEATLIATGGGAEPVGILVIDDNEAPVAGSARVRVVHGAGAAPTVDVLNSNSVLIPGLGYPFATGYLSLEADTYAISVAPAGSTDAVFSVNLEVPAGPVITIVAIGDPAAAAGAVDAFTLLLVIDSIHGANGNLRAVHAVAGGPVVNVLADGDEVFADVPYKAVSDYVAVPSGLYKVSVNQASNNAELFRSTIRVDAGGYFTAVAGGEGSNLALFQLRDDNTRPASGNAHLRVVHSSGGSPEVSLEVDGTAVGSLIYTEAFGYTPLPAPETYNVNVKAGSTSVFQGDLPLEADTVVSVFAVGIVGDNDNGFEVISAIDFDFRTPVAPQAPTTPTAAPRATPRAASSASIATVSVAMVALCALIL